MVLSQHVALPPGANPAVLRDLARRVKAKASFLDFVQYTKPDYVAEPVHYYVAARLQAFVEACEAKRAPRLILKMPPQHGKSQLSSRHLPAWVLGRHPQWRVALMSYSADWAHDLAQDARDVVTSEEYQGIWPDRVLDPSSTAVDDWGFPRKAGGGGMIAVGRDGSITGRSAEVLIVDDPVKSRKEADSETVREDTWKAWPHFRNRVQKGGGVLVVATQWHHDDLIGRLLDWQKEHPEADQYEVINLTALAEDGDPLGRELAAPLAPNRYDRAELQQLRASMPESDWQALYCGRPTPEEGAIFRADWLKFEVDKHNKGWIFQAADTAYSKNRDADFTVITTWRVEKTCYRLLDVTRGRFEFPELKAAAIIGAAHWNPLALLVEDIGSGKSLAQQLEVETRLPVLPWKPDGDKRLRANAVTHLFAAGKVIFPKDAPWLRDYVNELLQFPAGAHDDQVDATTMALAWAHQQGFAEQHRTEQKTLDFSWDTEAADDSSGLYAELGIDTDRERSLARR